MHFDTAHSPPRTHLRPRARRLVFGLWLPALLLTLSATVGCMKSESGGYAVAPDSGYDEQAMLPPAEMMDITESASYEFEDDLARGEMVQAPMSGSDTSLFSATSAREESKQKRRAARNDDPSPGFELSADDTEGEEPTLAEGDEQSKPHGREIIYVAGLQISVYNLETAVSAVETVPDRYGGWVHMRSANQVVLRIPAAKLKPVMKELAKLGVVLAQSLQAQDVTAEYVDLESRIKVLRETQSQLLQLLGKAKTVEEALHVRAALDQVTMELEVALGRMRQLGDLISFSTLTVTLSERGPQNAIPTSNDPFRWVDELGVDATEWR